MENPGVSHHVENPAPQEILDGVSQCTQTPIHPEEKTVMHIKTVQYVCNLKSK